MDARLLVPYLPAAIVALALALLAAWIARAELTLLHQANDRPRRGRGEQGPARDIRAFPRSSFVSLWLLDDVVVALAAVTGLIVEGPVLAAALAAVTLVSSFTARGLSTRGLRSLSGRIWHMLSGLRPLSRTMLATARSFAALLRRPIEGFVEGDGENPERSEKDLDPEEQELLAKIRGFGGRHVRDVMTPRIDIFSLSVDIPPVELLAAVNDARFSRVPIHHGDKDHVVGILYVRDLRGRRLDDGFHLEGVLHRPAVVSPDARVDQAFRELRRARVHLALVYDDLGTLLGLVTMEDLLEELFGEIRDESDGAEPSVERVGNALLVPGRLPISDLESALQRHIQVSGDETTVGGVLMASAGQIPRVAEQHTIDGLRFTVERREGNVLRRVRVEPIEPTDALEPAEPAETLG